MPDLVEDREAVVEEIIEDVVEEVARALREELASQLLVALAAREQPRDGKQLHVRKRDQEVGAEEDVQLGGVEPLDALVVDGEVEDDEEVARVLVHLGPLALGEDVLDVELVEAEALCQLAELERGGSLDVNPGESARGELVDPRSPRLDRVPG